MLNSFYETLLKWWCEAMDNEADSRCNLLFTHRHISQTSDGTQIRGLSAQMLRYVPRSSHEQQQQFAKLTAEYCATAEGLRRYECKKEDPWLQPVLQGAKAFDKPTGASALALKMPAATPTMGSAAQQALRPAAHALSRHGAGVLNTTAAAKSIAEALKHASALGHPASHAAGATPQAPPLKHASAPPSSAAAHLAAAHAHAAPHAHAHAPPSAAPPRGGATRPRGHPHEHGAMPVHGAVPEHGAAARPPSASSTLHDSHLTARGAAEARTSAVHLTPELSMSAEEVWEMGKGRGLRLNDAQVEAIHAVITGGAALPHSGVQAGVAVLQAVVSQLVAKAADGPQSAS